jgi:hypothetical protein
MNPSSHEKLCKGLHKFASRARDEAGNMEKTNSQRLSESNAETKIKKKFTLPSHFFLYQSAI